MGANGSRFETDPSIVGELMMTICCVFGDEILRDFVQKAKRFFFALQSAICPS